MMQIVAQPVAANNQSEEAEMEDEEVEEELFSRGPSRFPQAPAREEEKPVITSQGDTHWIEETTEGRLPNGILGLIVRDKFPGLVTYEGKEEPAFSWKHYLLVPDPITDPERQLNNLLERVEEDFCLYFRWVENTEHHARRNVHNVTHDLIPRMFYEGRIQSVITYHKNILKRKIGRSEACRTYLTVEQYMQAKSWWAMKCPQAWRKIAELKWCKNEWKALSCAGRKRKEQMPAPAHYQGSASMPRYKRKLEKQEKRPISDIEAYSIGKRVDKRGSNCNPKTKEKLEAYRIAALERHGLEFKWIKEPIDGVVVHKAGGGKKHGRWMIGDGFINTELVLSEVRSSRNDSTDAECSIRQPWTAPESSIVQQLRQELQEVRQGRQEDWEFYNSEIQSLRAEINAYHNLVPAPHLETSESEVVHNRNDFANDVLQGHVSPSEDQIGETSPVIS